MIFDIENIDLQPLEATLRMFARTLNELSEKTFNLQKDLKFKKLYPDVKTPVKANNSDMCFDIYAYSDPIYTDTYIEYKTGLVFMIPNNHDMLLYPRSSISTYDLMLANSVGVVDQSYRNEILFRYKLTKLENPKVYQKGDKIGQATIITKNNYNLIEVEEIDINTDRGLGGFGSSGK
jgi:dUTP pyrophosphatase